MRVKISSGPREPTRTFPRLTVMSYQVMAWLIGAGLLVYIVVELGWGGGKRGEGGGGGGDYSL
jgi:hypothetical protein